MASRGVANSRQARARTDIRRAVLTIAGADSSGGAGIQADLRVIAAYGLHGLSAITAVTAQTTARVHAMQRVAPATLQAQLETATDFDLAAIKIGMLGSTAAIRTVASFLRRQRCPTVLDPVLLSSSGAKLLPAAAIRILREELIPHVTVLTPNLPEAETLLGRPIDDADAASAAYQLRATGCTSVLLKGGHGREDSICDYLAHAGRLTRFRHRRLPLSARGTGCTLSTAIACGLAQGLDVVAAVRKAERYLQRALRRAYRSGTGEARTLAPA